MEKSKNSFTCTFDQNLITILVSYLDFQSAFQGLSNVNKQVNSYFVDNGVDYIWKLLFTTEFSAYEYPDHKKANDESNYQYFKRSFMKFKVFRELLKNIFELTNQKRSKKQYGFLRNYEDREVPQFHYIEEQITFEIECLFKNLNDQDPCNMVLDPDEEHEYFSNFKLHTMSFNNYNLQTVLLTSSSILNFRMILQLKTGIKGFPFTHTNRYRQCNFIDLNNTFGMGNNTVFSMAGTDKSHVLLIAPNIETYLSRHYSLLKDDNLFIHNGEIHQFTKNPLVNNGSVSTSNGLKIEVQAQINHMFCRFDSSLHEDAPKYSFVYQMRISVDTEEEAQNNFVPCKLLQRHYRIFNKNSSRIVAGNGLSCQNKKFPIFNQPTDPVFIYTNVLEMNDLDYTVEGYFTLRYLKEGEKADDTAENVSDVDPSLLFKVYINPFKLCLPEGQEFIKNPDFQGHMNYE
ncbi:UNKNOWN [Stylonychia lemnae]|uniref:ApaG domain-containing protein n=1 Tax=Stylonychia lemnae TaxID=5949 RepID=A0A078AY11_STYLE|nr:UNKNOWN [Stylonychia lemnae]|eukprot:CDW87006.1 UNKNOWN [Stylonychia lemnae]